MKFGVLVFPGSNCDHDTYNVIAEVAHQPVTFLWHDSEDLKGVDAVLVPGGFAYGDYLRTGAIARFSPVMQSVKKFADGGGLVLGICNGFQILTESGIAAGRADAQRRPEVHLQAGSSARGDRRQPVYEPADRRARCCRLPIGHMEGNYFCEPEELERLEAEDRIAFRYATPGGEITPEANPNGSLEQHCRNSERGAQCAGHDAASRPLQREAAGLGRWLEDLCVND